jgi:hypothetical protein
MTLFLPSAKSSNICSRPLRRRVVRAAPRQRFARVYGEPAMKTSFILLAQYDGLAVIPLDAVCREYFRHLTVEKLLRKVMLGEIKLPITRMEGSQKAARGVHINDLAAYLDKQAEAARKECAQLSAGAG